VMNQVPGSDTQTEGGPGGQANEPDGDLS